MPDSIAFLEDQPEVAFRPDGVRITYKSGSSTRQLHCTHSFFQYYMETNLRRHREWMQGKQAERGNVIEGRFTQHG